MTTRTNTNWGITLVLLIALLLAGGLFWASALVQKNAPEGGRRGRRAYLGAVLPGQEALSSPFVPA
jgi:hypothetical protein